MMESQQVFVCSADVAAFVDALETIGYPMVETQIVAAQPNVDDDEPDGQLCRESPYVIENVDIIKQQQTQLPSAKRFRLNAKEYKDVMEKLFEEQKAVVTEKSFMNVKGNKRFKSDVWSWFGDVKLLISRSEAKSLNIPYYFRQCGNERMMLSKLFVACFRCNALFIHDAQRSGTSTLRAHMRVCSRPRPRKKKGSPTIIFFQSKRNTSIACRTVTNVEKVSAPEQVLNFLLSTQGSFDTVDDPEFVKLLEMCMSIGMVYGDINIESMLCPQEKLSDFLLHDLYMSSVNAFYTEFQYSYGASFSVNIWTDEDNKNQYISIMCHYATSSGELKTVAIHSEEFDAELRTPEEVKDWFTSFLTDMPVIPFKRLIVTDSLSRCSVAFKDEENVKCAFQGLSLVLENVVGKALSPEENEFLDFTPLITGCNDIVCYFEQVKSQYSLPERLKPYNKDNWSSIVSMLRSIHGQYEEILNVLNKTGDTHLFSVDKAVIAAVIELFRLFEEAQTELSSSTNPSLNILIPWITKIRKYCLNSQKDFLVVQQLKKMILSEVNDTLAGSVTVYHRIATLLDPRFKRLIFLPREDQIAANIKIKCLVKECMEAPLVEEVREEQRPQNESGSKGRFSESILPDTSNESGTNSEQSAHKEVDSYLAETFSIANYEVGRSGTFDALKYWAQNSDRYPNLSRIAFWILSCPASCKQTVDSYSSNNWLISCFRIHQKPDYVNKVLFVKSFKNL